MLLPLVSAAVCVSAAAAVAATVAAVAAAAVASGGVIEGCAVYMVSCALLLEAT